MNTCYLIDAVMLALPPGHTKLSDLQISDLCRGDLPQLERRKLASKHRQRDAALNAIEELKQNPNCVMVAMIEWRGRGEPDINKPGTLQIPGTPEISVHDIWERPYNAALSRYGFSRGITVTISPWQRGSSDVRRWRIGGGEWPVWTRPA
jgi:hypothetical protein